MHYSTAIKTLGLGIIIGVFLQMKLEYTWLPFIGAGLIIAGTLLEPVRSVS